LRRRARGARELHVARGDRGARRADRGAVGELAAGRPTADRPTADRPTAPAQSGEPADMTTPRAFSLTEAEHRRIERIDQLVLLGAAGVGELMADLNDASWTVRRAAVAGLAALGDDAVDPLCRWLSRDRSSERAISAVVD